MISYVDIPSSAVKGNVVIDAFRLYPSSGMLSAAPPNPLQSTGNRGHISKSTTQQKQRGCGREFYRLPIRWDIDSVLNCQ